MGNGLESLIQFDWSGAQLERNGIAPSAMEQLAGSLEDARREVLEADARAYESGEAPPEKVPLDAGFLDMPQRLLDEYEQQRTESELGQILTTAQRVRESVDRVVLLGIGGSYMGARALMEACCHPYHNEQSRQSRANRPRMYFEGNNVDNDASQGLLDLLDGADVSRLEDRWAIVVISKSGGTLETAVAFRQFMARLSDQYRRSGDSSDQWRNLVIPVTGDQGKLRDLATEIGCPDVFRVPDGVGGRFSIFSAVGLLPAAILGIDIIKLLKGAVRMNEHFRQAPPGKNVVLDYVGVTHLLEQTQGVDIRVMSVWAKSLEAVGLWYDQLLAESLGKSEKGATPITAVNTRDLHSRAQQHQEGKRDKLMVNLTVEQWRRDPLAVGSSQWDDDGLNRLADRKLPDLMRAAIAGTNQAYREDERPTVEIQLPTTDEASLGQLLQMLMLATVVEGRLIGTNPYGQPGVEAYKRHMNAKLSERG